MISGKIYALKSSQTKDIYIGSTTRNLKTRFIEHKSKYKKYREGTFFYTASCDLIKYDDCKIELIKEFEGTLKQLHILEGQEIENNENCINRKIEGNIIKYETRQEYEKYYRQTEQRKQYIKNINVLNIECKCGGTYKTSNKHRHTNTKRHLLYIKK